MYLKSFFIKTTQIIILLFLMILPSQGFARENVLYIITGAHQDLGYGYTYKETMDEYVKQLRGHVDLIERNPEIRFSMGNTNNTKDFVLRYPQYKERLKKLMAAGNITTPAQWTGGESGWFNGEFLVRTVTYPKYWAMSRLGHTPHWFQFNDTPSITPQLAQILAKSDIHLLQGSHPGALLYILGEGRFWYYVGLDGSKVPIYLIDYGDAINFSDGFSDGEGGVNQQEFNHWAGKWARNFRKFKTKISLAATDHGTEVERSQRLKKFVKDWNRNNAAKYGFRVEMKTEEDFARYVKNEIIGKNAPLPEMTGTANPWPWAGSAWNLNIMRQHSLVENRLLTVEKLAGINELLGLSDYPALKINRAWEDILWYPDHNWGWKADTTAVKKKSVQRAYDLTNKLLQANLKKLAASVNYKNQGTPLLVFNPLNWSRTENVSLELKKIPQGKWAVFDARGEAAPAQLLLEKNKKGRPRLLFQAKDVPGMGYKVFYLRDKLSNLPKVKSDLTSGKDFVENSYYKVSLAADGSIKSIYDKKADRELVDDSKEHKFGGMNAYSKKGFKIADKVVPSGFKLIENGSARVSLQVTGHILDKKLPVSMTVRLSAYTPWVEHEIELDTGLNKGGGSSRMFFYLAPFKDLSGKGQVGVPYGSMPNIPDVDRMINLDVSRRSPDRGFIIGDGRYRDISKWQKDIQKWINLGDGSYSVDLAFDNIQTRTFFRDRTFPVTHLLAYYPGNILTWRVLIRGHKGDWRQADTPRFGWEASNPLLAVQGQRGKGKLPEELSFITLEVPSAPESNNVILSVFKKAFDGQGYIVRFYEAEDKDVQVSVKVTPLLNIPRIEVSRVNLIEKPLEKLTMKNDGYLINALGYGIESVGFFPRKKTDDVKPAGIADLKAGRVTSSTVQLNWTASGDDKKQGTAGAYELGMSSIPLNEGNWGKAKLLKLDLSPKASGSKEQYMLSGLKPDTKYYFALKVIDESGNISVISNLATAKTEAIDTTAPAAVYDLRVSRTDAYSVVLQWTATGDDGQEGRASNYMIGYAAEPINEANWASANRLSKVPAPKSFGETDTVEVLGLTPNTKYYFALKAVDEVKHVSHLSNVVSQRTSKPRVLTITKGFSDTHVSGVNEEEGIMNYGKSKFTRNWAWGVRTVLLKFGLGSIPEGAHVSKAVLKIYSYDITYGDAGSVIAYRLTQDWDEMGSNWRYASRGKRWKKAGGTIDRGTDFGLGPNGMLCKAPVVDGGSWVELDITRLVRGWLSGKYPNYGVAIHGNCPEDCGIYYRSREHKNKKLHPVVEISY